MQDDCIGSCVFCSYAPFLQRTMSRKIEVFDSTMRDGAQAEGISFSVEDKLAIARALDGLGVHYVEAGNPSSNPKDLAFFERARQMQWHCMQLVAFGSTRRKEIAVQEDQNCQALLTAGTDVVAIFGKTWDLHATEILHTTLEENLRMIEDTCAFFKGHQKKVYFDAEHFFDGYKDRPGYALEALQAALRGGADGLVLCDTNGGTFPDEIYQVTKQICARFPEALVGIHCHNDCGMAVANSIMAVKAGARHVQGTYLGYGERCGNANLSTIIPNLQLKEGYELLPAGNMQRLTATAHEIAEISNINLPKTDPFVGRSAFAHKAGMHADGVLKNSRSFEQIDPEQVGNERRFLMSEIAGRAAVLKRVHKLYPDVQRDSPKTSAIIETLKALELEGYQFEGAESSFDLIVRKVMGDYKPYFDLVSYKVLDEMPSDNGHSATATIKLKVEGTLKVAAAEGDGPVHALDVALREALMGFYPSLADVYLIDYKVRVIESRDATAAKVRVLITSTDGQRVWTTVGVAYDIIEASWKALVDSIEYSLN